MSLVTNNLWGIYNSLNQIKKSISATGKQIERLADRVPECWMGEKAVPASEYIAGIGKNVSAIEANLEAIRTQIVSDIGSLNAIENEMNE